MKILNSSFVKFGLKSVTAILLLAVCIQGCKKDPFSYQEQVRQELVYNKMSEDTSLSIWIQALDKANMSQTLNTYGPFTIFAPDNNAFRKYFAGKGKKGIDDFTADELHTLLVYHILPTRLKSGAFVQGPQPVSTGVGDFISLDISKGYKENTIANSVARLYQTDIEYSNAILHKMDAVLTPPTLSIGQFLEQNKEKYSIMIAGLKRVNLWDTVTNLTDVSGNRTRLTLFAESNDVLKAAGIQSFDNMPLDKLDTLMRYHMIAGANFSASYTHKSEANATVGLYERWDSAIVTLNKQQWIYFDLAADKLINSTANFSASDVIMRNGTLHVLDKHIEWNPAVRRTQIYHWFRTASNWAYGLPSIGTNQPPAVNGSGRWRTFAENSREFVFFDPDGANDSCVTIVKNVCAGKYRINISYKAGGRGTYQLKCGDDFIGVPTFLGQSSGTINGGLYNQNILLGIYEFKTTGDQRLNFVTTALPGVAFDNLVLTPEY